MLNRLGKFSLARIWVHICPCVCMNKSVCAGLENIILLILFNIEEHNFVFLKTIEEERAVMQSAEVTLLMDEVEHAQSMLHSL